MKSSARNGGMSLAPAFKGRERSTQYSRRLATPELELDSIVALRRARPIELGPGVETPG
jgi:hypothetical protein